MGQQQRFRALQRSNIEGIPAWQRLDSSLREAIEVVSNVLPFRTNQYVVDELIDWSKVPDDPIFQLTFPQRGMLDDEHYERIRSLVKAGADRSVIEAEATRIRYQLNPHPAGQMTHNVPMLDGEAVPGVQHKYEQTVLFFPSQGQTCHAYCTFCFRWAQFVGLDDLKFAAKESERLAAYLRRNEGVTDVLFTGGDPMIMKTAALRRYIEPLLSVESVRTIRIGTKAIGYWPQRFVTDEDADDLLRLFEEIVRSGRHLALMGHFSHPVELSTRIAREAISRIRGTGANIRMQSPIIRHVNDDANAWAELWREGVRLGCVPYYMFVERDTGAKRYFELPLTRAWEIYCQAYQQVSGLSRTVRGPVMSCFPGKVHVLGVVQIGNERAFALQYLQARSPELTRRPFFAKYDPKASWYDHLMPFGEADRPFFLREGSIPKSRLISLRSNGSAAIDVPN